MPAGADDRDLGAKAVEAKLAETHDPLTEAPAIDKSNGPAQSIPEPAAPEPRAENIQKSRPFIWTDRGDMVSQQMSANNWIKEKHEAREVPAQRAEENAPLPGQEPSERQLPFDEDGSRASRNYNSLKLEHAERTEDQARKEENGEKTLTFFEDRNPDLDRSR